MVASWTWVSLDKRYLIGWGLFLVQVDNCHLVTVSFTYQAHCLWPHQLTVMVIWMFWWVLNLQDKGVSIRLESPDHLQTLPFPWPHCPFVSKWHHSPSIRLSLSMITCDPHGERRAWTTLDLIRFAIAWTVTNLLLCLNSLRFFSLCLSGETECTLSKQNHFGLFNNDLGRDVVEVRWPSHDLDRQKRWSTGN